MCLCLGPSLFGEDRRWSYPLIRDGFSFLTCMAFFPTLYLWQKSDVDSAFNFAIIVNLQLSTQHLIDCVCNLFTVYINPLTVLQQVGAVLTSSQRTALRELFTEATHLIPSAATACGRKQPGKKEPTTWTLCPCAAAEKEHFCWSFCWSSHTHRWHFFGTMAYRGQGQKVQKVMVQPIVSFLRSRTTVKLLASASWQLS